MLVKKKSLLVVGLVILVTGLFAVSVFAQTPDFGVANLNGLTPLKGGDLKDIVLRFIQIALGFLALIAVIIVIYAGFLWMLSRGDANKIGKARRMIVNAMIGMAIIILSYSIVLFVFSLLRQAGEVGPGGGGQCTAGECSGCFRCNADGTGTSWDNTCSTSCSGGPLGSGFRLRSVETAHEGVNPQVDVFACSNVEGIFNNYINQSTMSSQLRIVDLADGSTVAGAWTPVGNTLAFAHETGGKFVKGTAAAQRPYQAQFPKTLTDTTGLFLSSCDVNAGCTDEGSFFGWRFSVGDRDDTSAPTITSSYPASNATRATYPDRNVSPYSSVQVSFSESVAGASFMDPPSLDPASPACQANPKPAGCYAHPRTGVVTLREMNPPAQDPSSPGCQVSPRPAGCLPTTQTISIDNQTLSIEAQSKGFRIFLPAPNSLKPFTWYGFSVSGVRDLCGNTMSATVMWVWQTNGATPSVSGTYPNGSRICSDSRVSFTFGTSMYDHTVSLSLLGSDGSRFQIAMQRPSSSGATSVTNTDGTLRILDPKAPVDNSYRVFEFVPSRRFSENATYNAAVTTDLVIDSSGNTLTKNWQFTTTDAATCICSPLIQRIEPAQGPVGMCVTISGYCFTGTPATQGTPRDLTFNQRAGTIEGFGTNYLTSTIPTGASVGEALAPNVVVEYPGSQAQSTNQSIAFTVDQAGQAQGPCLFSLSPNRGPFDTAVTARGKNFGAFQAASSKLIFSQNVEAPVDAATWDDDPAVISSRVPTNAQTGAVVVQNTQGTSNAIDFTVTRGVDAPCSLDPNICSPDPTVCDASQNLICSPSLCRCIENGTTGSTTVRVTSATPACSAACTNSVVEMRFSGPLQPSSVNASAVELLPCTTSACASFGTALSPAVTYVEDVSSNVYQVFAAPQGALQTNTYYRAVLHNSVRGAGGELLSGLNYDRNSDGTNDSYSWTFKTKDSACSLSSVDVRPDQASATSQGATTGWYASALGSNQQCSTSNYINPSGLTWSWTQSVPAVADLTPNTYRATSKALTEGQTLVRAESLGFQDESLLTVVFQRCTRDAECANPSAGGLCPGSTCDTKTNTCRPVITSIVPGVSAVGDLVSINGCYFGSSYGRVKFTDNKFGVRPDSAQCGNTWSDKQIIVEVPFEESPADPSNDAVSGPIAIKTSAGLSATSTTDFLVNNGQAHPGICAIQPTFGRAGAQVSIRGKGFGASIDNAGGDRVIFSSLIPVDPIRLTWGATTIQAEVPPNSVTGPVEVRNNNVRSNPYHFTVLPGGLGSVCGTTNQQTNVCSPNITCNTGLWCPTTGANACTCQSAPAVTASASPQGLGQCRNVQASVVFNQFMQRNSLGPSSIQLWRGIPGQTGSTQVSASITSRDVSQGEQGCSSSTGCSIVSIGAGRALDPNASYSILVTTAVKSVYGVAPVNDLVFSNQFSTGAEVCELTSVEVAPSSWQFTQAGQEQTFRAVPKSSNTEITGISGVYSWLYAWNKSATDAFTLLSPTNTGSQNVRAVRNGQGTVTATASTTVDTIGPSLKGTKVSGSASISVFLCDNPWTYTKADHNFRLQYCRDGDPLLPAFNTQPTANANLTQPGPGQDEILFDALFLRPNSKDAIGLRIYKNLDFLDPRAWYNRNVSVKGSPSATTIDGYDALRDGRTVYVAAVNTDGTNSLGSNAYTNMYVLSYNEGADADTKNIFEQIIKNIRFNTNVSDLDEKAELTRDSKRAGAVGTLVDAIRKYGQCPALQSGTYIAGQTTSAWPSWNQELGRTLGVTLPKDPENKFNNCPSTHDPATCWNPLASGGQGDFQCPQGSHVIQYRYGNTSACQVLANLELKGVDWVGTMSDLISSTDTCTSVSVDPMASGN